MKIWLYGLDCHNNNNDNKIIMNHFFKYQIYFYFAMLDLNLIAKVNISGVNTTVLAFPIQW